MLHASRRLARLALITVVSLVAAAPAAVAQDDDRPLGWTVVFDDDAAVDSTLFFVAMAPGWHITTGPASLMYDEDRVAKGDFRIQMEVFLFPGESESGFGLMFGGQDLESRSNQSYFQFLLRRDGSFMIAHQAGRDLHVLNAWTAHDAVESAEAADEPILHTLDVITEASGVVFMVGGEEVARLPRSASMGLDGIVGFRIEGDLDLHVRSLTAAKADAAD